jgi:hypothetical protein
VILLSKDVINKKKMEISVQILQSVPTIYYAMKISVNMLSSALRLELSLTMLTSVLMITNVNLAYIVLAHVSQWFKRILETRMVLLNSDIEKDAYTNMVFHMFTEKDCACGFNAEGKGYCPLGYNKRENDLTIAFI